MLNYNCYEETGVEEYIRISTGLNNYKLINRKELDLEKTIQNAGNKDMYYGIYIYTDKHYDQWCKTKSLKGVRDVTTDKVVFDFDDANNPEKARRDALETIDRLVADGISTDNINLYFSGNRGFHVILTFQNERIERDIYENIVDMYAGDLSTLDPTVKDQQRLIRMPFTKNQKSGLYDIPISYDELNTKSIDEIRDDAKEIDNVRYDLWGINKVKPLPKFFELPVSEKPEVKITGLDVSKKPNWLSEARFALKEGFFEEGERNTACMILGATYKNNGIDSEECYHLLKRTLDKREARSGIGYDEGELQHEIIDTIYSKTWNGGQYTEENDLLKKVSERLGLSTNESSSTLIRFDEGISEFQKMSVGWRERLITTGIPRIDDNVMIEKGMMVGLLGAPGSGKTSFALNFAEHLSTLGKKSLFMSLDMHYLKVIARMMQKQGARMGKSFSIQKMQDIFDSGFENKDLTSIRDFCEENYHNIIFDNAEDSSLDHIERNIAHCKEEYGNEFNLVIIDYFEKIRSKYESDPTTASAHIASRLSGFAKRYDVAILVLLQPRKAAGDPRSALDNYTAIKGSSTIQQDCRVIMTMWRPGYNPQDNNKDDKYASIAVVKANLGEQCQMNFKWDGFSGTLSDMSLDERKKFDQLLEEIKRKQGMNDFRI